MHRAIQKQGTAAFLRQEAPFLVGALLIAELFYKFGSFSLECLAFLATWYAFSFVAAKIAPYLGGHRDRQRTGSPGI